jgi:hypothetical protein
VDTYRVLVLVRVLGLLGIGHAGPRTRMRASTSNIGPAKILTGVSGRWSITPSSVTATTVGTRALTLIRTGSGFCFAWPGPGS